MRVCRPGSAHHIPAHIMVPWMTPDVAAPETPPNLSNRSCAKTHQATLMMITLA